MKMGLTDWLNEVFIERHRAAPLEIANYEIVSLKIRDDNLPSP
jgi:hypothetical protein